MKTCFVTLLMLLFVGCHVRDMEKEYVFRIPDGPWPDSSLFNSPINDLAEAKIIAGWGVEDPNDIGDMSNYGDDYMYYRLNILDSCCQIIARVSKHGRQNYLFYKDKRGNIKLCVSVADRIVSEKDGSFYLSRCTVIKGDSMMCYIIKKNNNIGDYKYDTIIYGMSLREWLSTNYDFSRKKRRRVRGEL